MIIYLILLGFIISFSFLSINREDAKATIYFIIGGLFVFLLPTFRNENVGTDTHNYLQYYIFPLSGYNQNQSIEIGYRLLSDSLRGLGFSKYSFLFTITAFAVGTVIWFVNKHSKYKSFSLFLFIAAGVTSPVYFTYFAGMRQIIALGLVLILFNELNKEHKNWLLRVALFLLAMSFHVSAIVVFPMLFIDKFQFSKKIYYLLIVSSFFLGSLIEFYASEIADILNFVFVNILHFASKGNYLEQHAGSLHSSSKYMIMLPYSLLGVLLIKYNEHNKINSIFFKIFFAGIILNNLLVFLPMAFRMVVYYTIVIIVLVPNFYRNISVSIWIRFGTLVMSFLYFSYKYYAVLSDMVYRGGGNIITPYSTFFAK